ncbi:lipoprotein [Vibrio sp. ZSDE26]|uniref:Lipoprotein n=1 Tax=Vibrio amylolyticus TaxID=2847292 RepID=A0A9X1XMN9_9VIBR|nr:lipoprotein [Vibrio amylolyticus]MCK6265727.1 lipoprotein [Vibrio amylolyticus]
MKFRIVHLFYPIAFLDCGAIIGGIESIITRCKMKKSIVALFMLSIFTLAGCGQTGGLYMPEEAAQNEQAQ